MSNDEKLTIHDEIHMILKECLKRMKSIDNNLDKIIKSMDTPNIVVCPTERLPQ